MLMIFRSEGQLCIKNRSDSVLEITARAQERFQKSLFVNTAQRNFHKYKLKFYDAEKKRSLDQSSFKMD